MSTNVQNAIQLAVAELTNYAGAVQHYNNCAMGQITNHTEQRMVYDAWVNAKYTYVGYIAQLNEIKQALTTELLIPVTLNSCVGIGILGVGVIYIEVGIGINGDYVHPIVKCDNGENMPNSSIALGGLPDGTYIYTNQTTYVIEQGQAINLMV